MIWKGLNIIFDLTPMPHLPAETLLTPARHNNITKHPNPLNAQQQHTTQRQVPRPSWPSILCRVREVSYFILFAFCLCFCLGLLLHCGEYYCQSKHAQGSHNTITRQTETNHDAKLVKNYKHKNKQNTQTLQRKTPRTSCSNVLR